MKDSKLEQNQVVKKDVAQELFHTKSKFQFHIHKKLLMGHSKPSQTHVILMMILQIRPNVIGFCYCFL